MSQIILVENEVLSSFSNDQFIAPHLKINIDKFPILELIELKVFQGVRDGESSESGRQLQLIFKNKHMSAGIRRAVFLN